MTDVPDPAAAPTDDLRDRVVKALRTVKDPEIPVNIHDLGLIYDLEIGDAHAVHVRMTLTSPNCPVAEMIPSQAKAAVEQVEGVGPVTVELVWEPAWTPDRMSEVAKLELEFTGHTAPEHLRRKPGETSLTVGRTGTRRPGDRPRRPGDRPRRP